MNATTKDNAVYKLLALAVLLITVIPVGIAVFVLGFIYGDSPCVMCWEQRTGMALVALVGLFVLRYGARPKYIGLSILAGGWGILMGVRHTSMHATRDVGQGFSVEILGAHTYTWALFVFWVCVVTMGILLMVLKEGQRAEGPRDLGPLDRLAMVAFLIVIAGNAVQAFASTGPPPFMGQSDPIRFSFNPKHWVWSADEWSYAPVSLRGRWAIEKPGLASLSADPSAAPIPNLPVLAVKQRQALTLPLRGTPTGLAYDSAADRFLLTTQEGVYIVDSTLGRVLRYTIIDPGFSVDLGRFADAAFLDSHTVMAVGENKSYVILRENDSANADKNFRYFLESFDKFDEVSRSRFGTMRAKMMYTMSLAFDASGKSLYTVSVPNSKVKRLVVSRFDRRDLTLSEEYTPVVAAGLKLAEKRSLDEFYVTAATVDNGQLLLLSAAYNTLLTIDLATHQVVAAHAIPGLSRPVGLAAKGDELWIAADDGTVTTVAKPVIGQPIAFQ